MFANFVPGVSPSFRDQETDTQREGRGPGVEIEQEGKIETMERRFEEWQAMSKMM